MYINFWIIDTCSTTIILRGLKYYTEIGTKLGFLTDINKDNIPYCKALWKLAIEVRHLDGVKANFAVRNTECIGIVTMNEELQQPEQQEQKDDEGLQQQQQQIMQPQSLWQLKG